MKMPLDDFIYQNGAHKGRVNQKLVQTGNPRGTYKRGDKHPFVSGVVYLHIDNNREYWATEEGLVIRRNKSKRWTQSNKARKAVYNRKWRKNNKEKEAAYKKEWAKNNKGNRAANEGKRRAVKAKSLDVLTQEQLGEIKQIYTHAARVSKKLQIPFEVDHIVPLSKGGLHHPLNLQVVPARWNRRKFNNNTDIWSGL